MAALEIRNLTIGWGQRPPVLADFSLTLAERSFTCVVGPAGVGKSSLLRAVAGLVAPRGGSIEGPGPGLGLGVGGGTVEEGVRPVALAFQEPRLLPWRRVIDNVMFGLEGLGLGHDRRLRQAQSALALVGLADDAGRWPHQLTAGQRQRVNLARALAVRPRLMLLDEPFAALDVITRHGLQAGLLRLRRESGATFLFATHDLEEAVFLADRVFVLGGRPARVTRDFPVTIPHPRQREGGSFADQVRTLRAALYHLVADGEGI